jgi:hypothetical protein
MPRSASPNAVADAELSFAAPPRPKSTPAQPLRHPASQRSSAIRLRGLVPQPAASQRRRDQVRQAQRQVLRRGGSRRRRSYEVSVSPPSSYTDLLTGLHHREWFSVLARQMFNPGYALFQPQAADALTYQPNKVRSHSLAYLDPPLTFARYSPRRSTPSIFRSSSSSVASSARPCTTNASSRPTSVAVRSACSSTRLRR